MWERNEFKKKINSPLLLTAKDFLTCLKKKNKYKTKYSLHSDTP